MPSSIEYLNITFNEDIPVGQTTFPTGWTGSLPSSLARSFGKKVTINGPGTLATGIPPSSIGVSRASPGMSSTELSALLRTIGTSTTTDAPWGVGRDVQLDPGIYSMPTVALPTCNSISAPGTGVSVLKYSKHSTVVAESAALPIADDLKTKRGIHGRGVFRNFNIDGAYDDAAHAFAVHGIWYDVPVAGGDVHYMDNVTVTKCTGSGIKVNARDQFCGIRTKCGDNKRYGYELIDMNDGKLFAPGAQGNLLGALYLEHCATPKFYGCDFGNPSGGGFLGTWTVTMVNQARAMFCGGEIAGRVGIIGRNDQSTNKWEMSGNEFIGINFKIDPNLGPSYTYEGNTISATIYAEDVDGLVISNCKLQYDDNQPDAAALTATPNYFIQVGHSAAGTTATEGSITLTGMSNLAHRRSRPGEALPAMVCFKKNVCNRPELIDWGFPAGVLEIKKGLVAPKNYILAGEFGVGPSTAYAKADYPFAFMWATGLDLDNVATTFTLPEPTVAPPAGYSWMMRAWP